MVNEIWAKISARERLIVFGGIAVIVGWLAGLVLASVNACAGLNISIPGYVCPSFNYFTAGNAGLFAILGLVAAIGAVVVLYLKVAPNMNITWPMPVAQILLGVSAATLVCGVLVVLFQVTYGLSGAPVMMWLADIIFVAGGGLQAYAAYMEFTASKTAV